MRHIELARVLTDIRLRTVVSAFSRWLPLICEVFAVGATPFGPFNHKAIAAAGSSR